MSYYNDLRDLLRPLGVYDLDEGSIVSAELFAAGEALDAVLSRLEYSERESVTTTAEGEGLTRRERLFSHAPVNASAGERRGAIAALERIGADALTLSAVNGTLCGCGIAAECRETDTAGTVEISFPGTVGEPEEFDRIRPIIEEIVPCHLQAVFVFRYLTWRECEEEGYTWQSVEEAEYTWETFETAVEV